MNQSEISKEEFNIICKKIHSLLADELDHNKKGFEIALSVVVEVLCRLIEHEPDRKLIAGALSGFMEKRFKNDEENYESK